MTVTLEEMQRAKARAGQSVAIATVSSALVNLSLYGSLLLQNKQKESPSLGSFCKKLWGNQQTLGRWCFGQIRSKLNFMFPGNITHTKQSILEGNLLEVSTDLNQRRGEKTSQQDSLNIQPVREGLDQNRLACYKGHVPD